MSNDVTGFITKCMASAQISGGAAVQMIQIEHRIKLTRFWGIHEGAKVLEIGCGQGDTTAVLAYFAGSTGLVHGIDIGPPDYGAPITIGDSADYLMKSPLGHQIRMEFEVDILSADTDFPDAFFDFVVFSHCSWYLSSPEELVKLLRRVRAWGKQLCFAEWDTRVQRIEQYPHLLAVLIQAQYESFKNSSESNVRTLFTPSDIQRFVQQAGWTLVQEASISSPELQDGQWEVDKVLLDAEEELQGLPHLPGKSLDLLRSQILMLKDSAAGRDIQSLPVYAFSAV